MTEPISVPKVVKQEALEKWARGKSCTEENWRAWWYDIGREHCSFCICFICENCPIDDGKCADGWQDCSDAYDNYDYPTFIAAASAMYDRIVALPEED